MTTLKVNDVFFFNHLPERSYLVVKPNHTYEQYNPWVTVRALSSSVIGYVRPSNVDITIIKEVSEFEMLVWDRQAGSN